MSSTADHPTEQPPAVAYAAKSTADPKDSTGSQLRAIRDRLARDGRKPAAEHSEAGVSGYTRSRGPRLAAATADAVRLAAEHGTAELWVFHSSRLGRGSGLKGEAQAVGGLFYDLRRQGVTLRSVEDDEFVTNQQLIGITSEQAAKFSRDLSAHTRRGLRDSWERGGLPGGPTPDGYRVRVDRDDRDRVVGRSLQLDPDRAAVMRKMFALALDGHAPAAAARALNADGHRTQGGQPFTRRRVQDTLSNPVYAGTAVRWRRTDREERRPAAHPAIVTEGEQARIIESWAQRDRASERRPANAGRNATRHALAKLAVCGACGAPMYAVTSTYKRKDGTKRRTYKCGEAHFATGVCDAKPVDAELVDAAVISNLPDLLNVGAWADALARERDERRAPIEEALDAATAEVRRLDAAMPALERRAIAAAHDDDAHAAAAALIARARADRALAEQEAAGHGEALRAIDDAPAPGDALHALSHRLADAVATGGSMADVNARLRAVLAAAVLTTRPDGSVTIESTIGTWAFARPSALGTVGVRAIGTALSTIADGLDQHVAKLEAELRRRGVDVDAAVAAAKTRRIAGETPPDGNAGSSQL